MLPSVQIAQELLMWVQRGEAIRMFRHLDQGFCADRLRAGLVQLAFQCQKLTWEMGKDSFLGSVVTTGGDGFKLEVDRFRHQEEILHGEDCGALAQAPQRSCGAPSLVAFKNGLDRTLGNQGGVPLPVAGWIRWSLSAPSNPNNSVISHVEVKCPLIFVYSEYVIMGFYL